MNLLQIIENFVRIIGPLTGFVNLVCYVMGAFMFLYSIIQAMKRAEMGPGTPGGWGAPISTFFTASIFMVMPQFVSIMNTSLFAVESVSASRIFELAPNTVANLQGTGSDAMIEGIVAIIQFLGLIAMVRGVYLINQSAQGGQGPPTFGPGATFLIAGTMARMFPLFLAIMENLIA